MKAKVEYVLNGGIRYSRKESPSFKCPACGTPHEIPGWVDYVPELTRQIHINHIVRCSCGEAYPVILEVDWETPDFEQVSGDEDLKPQPGRIARQHPDDAV